MTKIYDNIRSIRVLKNLSQEYLAESLGISQSAYGKLERGETKVTWEKLNKIAEILGTTPFQISDFNSDKSYQSESNVELAAESNDIYIRQMKDIQLLSEKIKLLEKLNVTLHQQLKDKDEIIDLLRIRRSEQ